MASLADITPENFAQFQAQVPRLQSFPNFEAFVGTIQNPSFNPGFLQGLIEDIAPPPTMPPSLEGIPTQDVDGRNLTLTERTRLARQQLIGQVQDTLGNVGTIADLPPDLAQEARNLGLTNEQIFAGTRQPVASGPQAAGPQPSGGGPGKFGGRFPVAPGPGGGGGGGGPAGGGGGGGFSFGGPGGAPTSLLSNFNQFFQGRNALLSQNVSDLGFLGASGRGLVEQAIPEFAGARSAAEGALSGADLGADFTQALQGAAGARGLATGQVAEFDAGLASQQFLPQAGALAQQTAFGGLQAAGFVPPQKFDFGTLGSLNIQQAELQAQIQSGQSQAAFSQNLFGLLLPQLTGAT